MIWPKFWPKSQDPKTSPKTDRFSSGEPPQKVPGGWGQARPGFEAFSEPSAPEGLRFWEPFLNPSDLPKNRDHLVTKIRSSGFGQPKSQNEAPNSFDSHRE